MYLLILKRYLLYFPNQRLSEIKGSPKTARPLIKKQINSTANTMMPN
jgi:hypothetical protein